jgi:hypothetical protein
MPKRGGHHHHEIPFLFRMTILSAAYDRIEKNPSDGIERKKRFQVIHITPIKITNNLCK